MLMQMLPGTDFIFSGYSSVPNYDNMFAGSNFDAEDFDDYNILQRDLQVDGGLRPVTEEKVREVRTRAAKAMQAVFQELGFPPISDEEVEQNVLCPTGSKDVTRPAGRQRRFESGEADPGRRNRRPRRGKGA